MIEPADVLVDAALNELVPADAQVPVKIEPETREVRLAGVGHGLAAGDVLALVSGKKWRPLVVTEATEGADNKFPFPAEPGPRGMYLVAGYGVERLGTDSVVDDLDPGIAIAGMLKRVARGLRVCDDKIRRVITGKDRDPPHQRAEMLRT